MFSVHHFKLSTFSLLNIYKANIAIAEKDTERSKQKDQGIENQIRSEHGCTHQTPWQNDESNCTNDIQKSIHQYILDLYKFVFRKASAKRKEKAKRQRARNDLRKKRGKKTAEQI